MCQKAIHFLNSWPLNDFTRIQYIKSYLELFARWHYTLGKINTDVSESNSFEMRIFYDWLITK